MSVKTKIIKDQSQYLNDLYYILLLYYNCSCNENISRTKAWINSKRFHRKALILAYDSFILSNRKIVAIRKKKKYHITKFGIRLFNLFYKAGYIQIPNEFVIYYDDRNNDIYEDKTIFVLKLGKTNNE